MSTFKVWIKDKKNLSLMGIEKELGISQGTIAKYLNGSRGMPEKHKESLGKFLERYGFDGTFD